MFLENRAASQPCRQAFLTPELRTSPNGPRGALVLEPGKLGHAWKPSVPALLPRLQGAREPTELSFSSMRAAHKH